MGRSSSSPSPHGRVCPPPLSLSLLGDSLVDVHGRTIEFLEAWIEHHFMSDFGMSRHRFLAQQLWRFLESHVKNTEALRMLTRSWDNQHYVRTREARRHPTPAPLTPLCRIDLSTTPLDDLAQQLTLIEYQLQDKIHLFDFLRKQPSEAPPIAAMVAQFNRISFWIATEIVKLATPKKRAHVIKQCITMAEYCASIGNYNSVLEITAGLNLIAIRRLHKTWRVRISPGLSPSFPLSPLSRPLPLACPQEIMG